MPLGFEALDLIEWSDSCQPRATPRVHRPRKRQRRDSYQPRAMPWVHRHIDILQAESLLHIADMQCRNDLGRSRQSPGFFSRAEVPPEKGGTRIAQCFSF